MLQLLPNELLVKILSKTRTETAKNCRLLSRRLDNIVVKFDLYKEDVKEIRIQPSKQYFENTARTWEINIESESSSKIHKKPFYSCAQLLKKLPFYVNFIRSVHELYLSTIEVSEEFLDMLVENECFSTIQHLTVNECNFMKVFSNNWMNYLESLQLNAFAAHNSKPGNTTPVPAKMFEQVKYFAYNCYSMETSTDMSWLDDKMLQKWYSPGKELEIWWCKTRLSVDGIIKYLEEKEVSNWGGTDFGTIENVTSHQIATALNRAQRVEWYVNDAGRYHITLIGKGVSGCFRHQIPPN